MNYTINYFITIVIIFRKKIHKIYINKKNHRGPQTDLRFRELFEGFFG